MMLAMLDVRLLKYAQQQAIANTHTHHFYDFKWHFGSYLCVCVSFEKSVHAPLATGNDISVRTAQSKSECVPSESRAG